MRKKFFLLALMAMMLPISMSAYVAEVDGIYYDFDETSMTASVRSSRGCYSGEVAIPSEVTYNGQQYSVTSIGESAFEGCSSLTSVTIPSSVTSIGDYAFNGCSSLTSVTIPSSVISIGQHAFYNCSSLTSVTIPNSVTKISYRAFSGCSSLTSVTIPNSVTSIDKLTFSGCSGLTSVIIPNSVKSIDEKAFSGCSSLTSVTIPSSVISIGQYAFYDCSSLTSVTIPNSVTSIGFGTFSGCSSLTSVTIPNSVTSIGQGAFRNCYGLTSVTIPNSVTRIEHQAFSNCYALTSLTIPNSVTYIGEKAFNECRGLTSIKVENGNPMYDSRNNCNAIIRTDRNELIAGCKNTTIPNSVTIIYSRAFSGCSGLTSVTIPNSVTKIGERAFCDCIDLSLVIIPSSVTSIGNGAFYNCSNISHFYIISEKSFTSAFNWWEDQGEGIVASYKTDLQKTTFHIYSGCRSSYSPLKPLKIEYIDRDVNGLVYMISDYVGSCAQVIGMNNSANEIKIESSVNIGDKTFVVNSIATDAFRNNKTITSVTIPNSFTSIPAYTFEGCKSLESVEIGTNVDYIEERAFANIDKLTSVICHSQVVPNADRTAFENSYIEDYVTLYVPEGSVSKYKETAPWKNFKEIVAIDETGSAQTYKLTYMVNGEVYKTLYINEGESITPESEPVKQGHTFSGWSKIPSTMPGNDVTVTGTFTINKYKLTYMIDGTEYKTVEVEYGSKITPENNPTKDGYDFSGWSDIPDTMPAHDVTVTGSFTPVPSTVYTITYVVDGEVYKTYNYHEGDGVTHEEEPTKEGYTFSGWSWIPSKMPGENVTITGTFTVNKYTLTYMIDGVEYKSYEVEYGSAITPETVVERKGFSFSGWENLPDTMPASDVVVTGSFNKGTYTLTYVLDGVTYKTYTYGYDESITPESVPDKEGYTFTGWSGLPNTMPAGDVTVTGSYTINKYKLIYMVDGEVYMTIDVEYGSSITPEDEPAKDGYVFSGWSWIPKKMPAEDVTVSGTFKRVGYNVSDNIYVIEGNEATFAATNVTSGDLVISQILDINNTFYYVTSIAENSCMNNTGITSVTIPDGVASVGDNAFYGCTGVKSLSLGKLIGYIGNKAFAYIGTSASSRKRAASETLVIECHASSVPKAQYDSFEGVDMDNAVLKVDDNLVNSYKSVFPWSLFTNIVGFNESTDIHNIYSDDSDSSVFSIDGRKIDKPQKGMNIIRTSQGTRKVMVK